MFLRGSKRRKDGKVHLYWSVVENRRLSDARVVQRHVPPHLLHLARERFAGLRVAGAGAVTNGLPVSGAARENATSRGSLSLPARGNSFRSGKNGKKHSNYAFPQD